MLSYYLLLFGQLLLRVVGRLVGMCTREKIYRMRNDLNVINLSFHTRANKFITTQIISSIDTIITQFFLLYYSSNCHLGRSRHGGGIALHISNNLSHK